MGGCPLLCVLLVCCCGVSICGFAAAKASQPNGTQGKAHLAPQHAQHVNIPGTVPGAPVHEAQGIPIAMLHQPSHAAPVWAGAPPPPPAAMEMRPPPVYEDLEKKNYA